MSESVVIFACGAICGAIAIELANFVFRRIARAIRHHRRKKRKAEEFEIQRM